MSINLTATAAPSIEHRIEELWQENYIFYDGKPKEQHENYADFPPRQIS